MSHKQRALYFQLGGFLFAIGCIFWLSSLLPVTGSIAALQYQITYWGFWSSLCYPLFFAACNVLLLPGGILSIGGGFFFGLWWGFLLILAGNIIGAAAAFSVARSGGRHWLSQRVRRDPRLRLIESAVERHGWKIVFLSQVHPLFPTSLLNYLYGLTSIRFRTCMLWVTIGRVPGLFLYAYLGTLGQFGLNPSRSKMCPVEYVGWGVGLIGVVGLLIVLSKIAFRVARCLELGVNNGDSEVLGKLQCDQRHLTT